MKHKKDNFSLDIKGIYKTGVIQTPFVKKKEVESHVFGRLKTQITHNTSMQLTDK